MTGKPWKGRFLRLVLHSAALFVALATSAPAVHACPIRHSETGTEVRAGLFNEDFAFNLFASIIPFPIFLSIVAAIHGVPIRGGAALDGESRPAHER